MEGVGKEGGRKKEIEMKMKNAMGLNGGVVQKGGGKKENRN